MRKVVLVLPLVPVTPTSVISLAGFPKNRAAIGASARRVSATTAVGGDFAAALGSSTSNATAPSAVAWLR